jgi:hypothetical protein
MEKLFLLPPLQHSMGNRDSKAQSSTTVLLKQHMMDQKLGVVALA